MSWLKVKTDTSDVRGPILTNGALKHCDTLFQHLKNYTDWPQLCSKMSYCDLMDGTCGPCGQQLYCENYVLNFRQNFPAGCLLVT